ncbi:MAG: glycosyltransferase family 39 protein [Salinivirgaceae bacterium]|nr:glycosyltransferase family 39 protein [Salinivirgaceae bacterium]
MKKAILIIIAFNLLRLIILPFMGMMPQDAYYFFYSENLSLSYFDHPPMVAYMLHGFSLLFGKSVIGVKLSDFIISVGIQLVFFKLSSKIIRSQKKYISWILLASTIMISTTSLVTTPDVPLLLFWGLSLLTLYTAIFERKNWYWIWAGIFMGLAFDSKYTALAIPAGLFLFLIFSKKYRGLLISPWPYISSILLVLMSVPVIIWNVNNDFASFAFQSAERAETISEITIQNFFGLIGTQFFLLTPVLFVAIWWVVIKYVKRIFKKPNQINPEIWFLLSFLLPMFIGFYILSFFLWVKMNWLFPTYITGIILVGKLIKEKWIKWQIVASVILHILFFIQVAFYVIPIKSDDTWFGWKELANETKELQKTHPNTFVFSDDNYKTTAQLMFHLDKKIYGRNIIGRPALQYDYVGDDLDELIGMDAIFIDSDKHIKNDEKLGSTNIYIKDYFSSIEELEPILIKKRGKTLRKFWVYYCKDYKGIKNKY